MYCFCVLAPGVNPIAVNKSIYLYLRIRRSLPYRLSYRPKLLKPFVRHHKGIREEWFNMRVTCLSPHHSWWRRWDRSAKHQVNSNLHTVHTARSPAPHNHIHQKQCRTPYAVTHSLVLLMMGIMMPETCWDKSLILNTRSVASCWFIFFHPTFVMHGHKSLQIRLRLVCNTIEDPKPVNCINDIATCLSFL